MTALRLAWRLQRWELGLSLLAVVLLMVGALVTPMTTLLGSDAWMTLLAFTLIVPMVAGLVLGVGIVGREIAMRTAHLAWTLEPRRDRWLLGRTWPVLLLIGLPCLALGLATGRLIDHAGPGQSYQLAMTGPIVALRFALALAVGIGLGAVLRREVPALMIGLPLLVAAAAGISLATEPWMRSQAEFYPHYPPPPGVVRVFEWEWAATSATGDYVLTEVDCTSPASCETAVAGLTQVMVALPVSAYWPYAGVELLATAAAAAGFGGMAVWAISRRGPD